MSDRENLHVAILRFGEDKLENGVTFDELRQHLQDLGFTVDQEYLVLLFYQSPRTNDKTVIQALGLCSQQIHTSG